MPIDPKQIKHELASDSTTLPDPLLIVIFYFNFTSPTIFIASPWRGGGSISSFESASPFLICQRRDFNFKISKSSVLRDNITWRRHNRIRKDKKRLQVTRTRLNFTIFPATFSRSSPSS